MCGVFGFVGTDGEHVNLKTLAKIARVTETRGRHAFGFAWVDGKGRIKSYKQTGRVSDHLSLLDMAHDARMLIGHCRYATQGDPGANINNHPHPADGGWIVHNGTIPEYAALVREFELVPTSRCDSEVLGLLIEREDGDLLTRCRLAAETVNPWQPLVLLGLWPRPGRLIAVRRGNPLSMGMAKEGFYLASLPEGLPGKVKEFTDKTAQIFGPKNVKSVEV